MDSTKIAFHFQPYEFDKSNHAVEKADEEGVKRKHLQGVSSGIKTDGHEERMTSNCIKSFMNQANSGDILLYPDVHGIKASEDIGILEKAEVLANGDWFTDYRLYDEKDEVGPAKLEKIDTIWKQHCGLPPYKHPRQKGFSVEGNIPNGGILGGERDKDGNIRKRVINDIVLEGVILVPRPAYKDSIATAVYKALGELPPEFKDNLRKSIKGELKQKVENTELQDKYFKEKWNINDSLESQVERIMRRSSDSRKKEQLEVLFDEYRDLMLDLIMSSENLFIKDKDSEDEEEYNPYGNPSVRKDAKIEIFQDVLSQLKVIQKRLN